MKDFFLDLAAGIIAIIIIFLTLAFILASCG